MLTFAKRISPTVKAEPGFCPCGAPGVVTLWEADLLLCRQHGFAWLRSPEKIEAGLTIEMNGGDVALRKVIDSFADQIRRRPSFMERLFNVFRRKP